jgi:hypothetical protein
MTNSNDYVWYFARTWEEAYEWMREVDELGIEELERRWGEEDRQGLREIRPATPGTVPT